MQAALDDRLVTYNTTRPHRGRNMGGRTPRQAFINGLKTEPHHHREKPKEAR